MQKRNETQEIYIPPGPRLGDVVIEAENISKAFGDKLLVNDLTFKLPPGGIVGIIGPNGAGKTTLFRMMAGLEQPDSGTLTLGQTVELAYVDQLRDDLDPKKTVFEEISDGLDLITVGKYETPSRAYVGRFNFKGADQGKRIGDLSGGERNRVHMAKLLKSGGNVLLLDEPTNDLDLPTLNVLENFLADYPGCILIVSHDRYFMDRLVDHLFVFEGEGVIKDFPGNYTQFRLNQKEEEKKQQVEESQKRNTTVSTEEEPAKKKMGFREKKQLDNLEREIANLEKEKKQAEEALCEPNITFDKITVLSNRIAEIIKLQEDKELKWLELSE